MGEIIKEIKFHMVCYLVGYEDMNNLVDIVDKAIKCDYWVDEFLDLSFSSTIRRNDILILIQSSEVFMITVEEMNIIERTLFNKLSEDEHYFLQNWFFIEEVVVKYFRLKSSLLNWTSNDKPDEYFSIENDFELRKDGFNGQLDMPYMLYKFLKGDLLSNNV